MKLAKLYVLSLSIAAVLAGPSAIAQTATTDPVGFSTVSTPVGTHVVVPTLLKTAVFTGNATLSTVTNTITPSVNPNWGLNAYQPTQFASPTPNYPTHYAEVAEGTYEGYGFDVVSNTAGALTVASGDIPAALNGQTVKVILRPHITLNDLLPGSTNLTSYTDSVSIYNGDGSIALRYYVNDGVNPPTWVAEDYGTPAGQTIVYPGVGIVFTANTPGASLVLLGPVKTTKTAVYLYAAAGVNLVGPMNPGGSTTLVSSLMSSIAGSMAGYTDAFSNFSTDGNLTTLGVYFSDGGPTPPTPAQLLDGSYAPLPPNSTDAVPVNRGVALNVGADSVWITKSPLNP